jgi:DNA invertase Pin-like site-specific DNA recombinase
MMLKLVRIGASSPSGHSTKTLTKLNRKNFYFFGQKNGPSVSRPTHATRVRIQILGAVAELERSLIVERVEADLRNARAKGKKLGCPRVKVDEFRVQALRDSGASWRTIAQQLNLTLGTVRRASQRSGELGSQATSRVGQEVLCA